MPEVQLSAWFGNLHDAPGLFAMRGDLEAADLDAGRFPLSQEEISPVVAPNSGGLASRWRSYND
jgi:hypothetical protein